MHGCAGAERRGRKNVAEFVAVYEALAARCEACGRYLHLAAIRLRGVASRQERRKQWRQGSTWLQHELVHSTVRQPPPRVVTDEPLLMNMRNACDHGCQARRRYVAHHQASVQSQRRLHRKPEDASRIATASHLFWRSTSPGARPSLAVPNPHTLVITGGEQPPAIRARNYATRRQRIRCGALQLHRARAAQTRIWALSGRKSCLHSICTKHRGPPKQSFTPYVDMWTKRPTLVHICRTPL